MERKRNFESLEKTAVAIAYEPGDGAPKILATGKGEVAEKIIEKANKRAKYFNKIIREKFAKHGLFLQRLNIESISLPEDYEKLVGDIMEIIMKYNE